MFRSRAPDGETASVAVYDVQRGAVVTYRYRIIPVRGRAVRIHQDGRVTVSRREVLPRGAEGELGGAIQWRHPRLDFRRDANRVDGVWLSGGACVVVQASGSVHAALIEPPDGSHAGERYWAGVWDAFAYHGGRRPCVRDSVDCTAAFEKI